MHEFSHIERINYLDKATKYKHVSGLRISKEMQFWLCKLKALPLTQNLLVINALSLNNLRGLSRNADKWKTVFQWNVWYIVTVFKNQFSYMSNIELYVLVPLE